MHFFGLWGSVIFIICVFIVLGLLIARIIDAGNSLTDSVWFFLALVGMLMGVQLFLAGFLGDLISRNAEGRNNYNIEKEL